MTNIKNITTKVENLIRDFVFTHLALNPIPRNIFTKNGYVCYFLTILRKKHTFFSKNLTTYLNSHSVGYKS